MSIERIAPAAALCLALAGCNSERVKDPEAIFDQTTQCWERKESWHPKFVKEGGHCMEVLEAKAECLVDGKRTWVPVVYKIPVSCKADKQ